MSDQYHELQQMRCERLAVRLSKLGFYLGLSSGETRQFRFAGSITVFLPAPALAGLSASKGRIAQVEALCDALEGLCDIPRPVQKEDLVAQACALRWPQKVLVKATKESESWMLHSSGPTAPGMALLLAALEDKSCSETHWVSLDGGTHWQQIACPANIAKFFLSEHDRLGVSQSGAIAAVFASPAPSRPSQPPTLPPLHLDGLEQTLLSWFAKYRIADKSPRGRLLTFRERFEALMGAIGSEKTATTVRHLGDIDLLLSLVPPEKHAIWYEHRKAQQAGMLPM